MDGGRVAARRMSNSPFHCVPRRGVKTRKRTATCPGKKRPGRGPDTRHCDRRCSPVDVQQIEQRTYAGEFARIDSDLRSHSDIWRRGFCLDQAARTAPRRRTGICLHGRERQSSPAAIRAALHPSCVAALRAVFSSTPNATPIARQLNPKAPKAACFCTNALEFEWSPAERREIQFDLRHGSNWLQ